MPIIFGFRRCTFGSAVLAEIFYLGHFSSTFFISIRLLCHTATGILFMVVQMEKLLRWEAYPSSRKS